MRTQKKEIIRTNKIKIKNDFLGCEQRLELSAQEFNECWVVVVKKMLDGLYQQ
jgi:hypothetical protein